MLPETKRRPTTRPSDFVVTGNKPMERINSLQVNLSRLLNQIACKRRPEVRLQGLQGLEQLLSTTQDESVNIVQFALEQCCDNKLAWQLSYELQQLNNHIDKRIITHLCRCLSLLWTNCSQERRQASLIQLKDYIPCFLHVWERFPNDNHILHPLLQIFRLLAKVKDAGMKNYLIHSGLIPRMRLALAVEMLPRGDDNHDHHHSNRVSVLLLIKDLSFRASDHDKQYLFYQLKHIVLENCREDSSFVVADAMSAVLWNWSTAESLGRTMGQTKEVWLALKQLWMIPIQKSSISIRRHVSSVFGTMVAAWTANTNVAPPAMLDEQTWLLPNVLEMLQKETDVDLRRRCMRTIRCLASCEWGRSFLWKHCPSSNDFMTILIQVLGNEQDGQDTRSQACQTISTLLPWAKEDWMSLLPCLETVLIKIIENSETDDKLVLVASQALYVSLTTSPWKRGASCFSLLFFERIFIILDNTSEPSFHERFSKLLLQLSYESLAVGDVSTMLNEPLLNSLALLLGQIGPDYQYSRKNAIEIILTLMKNDQSKKPLAENERLLTALVNFCLATSGEEKEEVKQVILKLVTEL